MKTIDADKLLELVRDGYTNAQLADHFCCTVRTLSRRRAADPALSLAIIEARATLTAANVPEHGTVRRYTIGCRCQPCTAAATIRRYEGRMARRVRLEMPPPNPNRGRRRDVTQVVYGRIFNASRATLIGQAIARGESTSVIMRRVGCSYDEVQAGRAEIVDCEQVGA